MSVKELHIVTTGKQTFTQINSILSKIYPYIHAVHIREKAKSAREIWEGIQLLLDHGVPRSKIVINDRIDIAHMLNLAGVHLAYHSLDVMLVKRHFPELKIGKSVHSVKESIEMEEQGADYLYYGHIFPTSSKSNIPNKGLSALREVVKAVRIPVIAIGGITHINVKEVLEVGAAGIAVMSEVFEADDPFINVQMMAKQME